MNFPANDRSMVLYTLKDDDHQVGEELYVSLYKRYLALEDVTEYTFANTYFDSFEHWTLLSETEWMKPHVARWRKELELQLKARAMEQLKEIAKDKGNKNSFEAIKILMNAGWKDKRNAGRPDKKEVDKQIKQIAEEESALNNDYLRIVDK
jgi:hypothetical protein